MTTIRKQEEEKCREGIFFFMTDDRYDSSWQFQTSAIIIIIFTVKTLKLFLI